ncbi:MAG: phenylalanine--tRNA ligase subunit alpha, partial [Lentisphaeria bacterium]|nr:phenylalanine--tRNA ligase subunit alpha [Lentisphaeria bacterium]
MLEELLTKLREITASAAADLEAAKTEADIDAVKNRTLGRNGAVTALSPMMGKLPNESKRDAGKAFNEAKTAIQDALNAARERLESGV